MTNSNGNFFQGKERLEHFPLLNRPMRKGSASEIAVSDYNRTREAIQKKDPSAKSYLEISNANTATMVMVYLEWLLAWRSTLNQYSKKIDGEKVTQESFNQWQKQINSDSSFKGKTSTHLCEQKLNPNSYNAKTIESYRKEMTAGLPTLAAELYTPAAILYQKLISSLSSNDITQQLDNYEAYFSESLCIHDLLVELVSLYPTQIEKLTTPELSHQILRESFGDCLFYQGMWQLVAQLEKEEFAAFMTEHLRAHFSGKDRKGTTQLIEEKDCYKLVVDPCGSGGAMRRRALAQRGQGVETTGDSSPENWHLKNQVPGYCTHCAASELESVKRLNYPIFVTEFNPDPNKPCGWTIYKDPNLIPEKYFDRLGIKKDPSLFKKLGKF